MQTNILNCKIFHMRYFLYLLLLFPSISFTENLHKQLNPKVVFLNPSVPDSTFFRSVTDKMKFAAKQLNVDLEVLYANRKVEQLRSITNQVILRSNKPDYVVLVNDRVTIPQLMPLFDNAGIKTIIFNGSLSEKVKNKYLRGDSALKNWIGSFTPNEQQSGYLLAQLLIENARKKKLFADDGKIHMFGLNGTSHSLTTIERENGLNDYVKEQNDVILEQVVLARWSRAEAKSKTKILLKRHPKTSVVWAASDDMALGVLDTASEVIIKSKERPLTCGIDWLPYVFEEIRNENIQCSVGGHVFDALWLMVVLKDHFNEYLPNYINYKTTFTAATKQNLHLITPLFTDGYLENLNLRKFSQSFGNKAPETYGVHLLLENK